MDVAIARVGTFTDANGRKANLTSDYFEKVVQNYDPAYHEAKATPAHYATEAIGRIKSVRADADYLYATINVPDKKLAASMLKDGLRNRVSAEFYPDLDGKGAYLRGAALLSGTPPAIKGLPYVHPNQLQPRFDGMAFSESDEGTVTYTFGEPDPEPQQESKMAVEATEHVFSEDQVIALNEKLDNLTTQLLSERDARLKAEAKNKRTEVESFVAKLGTRVTPAMQRAGLVDVLVYAESLTDAEPLTFSEGGVEKNFSFAEAFKRVLSAIPEGTNPVGKMEFAEAPEEVQGLTAIDLVFCENSYRLETGKQADPKDKDYQLYLSEYAKAAAGVNGVAVKEAE